MAGVNIVDFAKAFKEHGWTPGEHPDVGTGRVGKHAPNSYHYAGQAIDVTRQGPDMSAAYPGGPLRSWKDLTGDLKFRAKKSGIFTEVLGPGDPGHSTHTHLALEKPVNATPELMQWIATGRYKTPEGKLTDVMPGSQPINQPAVTSATSSENVAAAPTNSDVINIIIGKTKKANESDLETDGLNLASNDFLSNYWRSMLSMPAQQTSNSMEATLKEAFNKAPVYS